MKEIIFIRHAKSDWTSGISSDHERPLNGRGMRDGMNMSKYLSSMPIFPDLIYCSSSVFASFT